MPSQLGAGAVVKRTLAACALLLSGELAAQTYKCIDAAGKITYAGKICSDLGLKDAGEVKDRLNVQPAYRSPAMETGSTRSSPAAAAEPPKPAAPEETASPDRRCFTVKTAKGNVTRCNDTPVGNDTPVE